MKGDKKYKMASIVHYKIYNKQGNSDNLKSLFEKYFKLLREAAYQGHPLAQYNYAQQFEDIGILGMNNPIFNYSKSFYWYKKAAINDVPEALNSLGYCYEFGLGCSKDLTKAYECYKKSSELGYNIAKKNLKQFKKQYPTLKSSV